MSSSVDTRIKREAVLFKEEYDAALKQIELVNARRLRRLRTLLDDEISNMSGRCADSSLEPVIPFRWLHGKTFDETYRDDYGPEGQKHRTRGRINAILMLCGNDEELFYVEYTRALDKRFPIPLKSYEWNPHLILKKAGYRTVVHRWRPRRRVRFGGSSSDGG